METSVISLMMVQVVDVVAVGEVVVVVESNFHAKTTPSERAHMDTSVVSLMVHQINTSTSTSTSVDVDVDVDLNVHI